MEEPHVLQAITAQQVHQPPSHVLQVHLIHLKGKLILMLAYLAQEENIVKAVVSLAQLESAKRDTTAKREANHQEQKYVQSDFTVLNLPQLLFSV